MNNRLITLAAAASLCFAACRESNLYDIPDPVATGTTGLPAERLTASQQPAELSDTHPGALAPAPKTREAEPPKFDLLLTPCIRMGTTAYVDFAQPQDKEIYDITWYLDGRQVATGVQVDCLCGKEVTVVVVRRSDGANARRSAELYPCEEN